MRGTGHQHRTQRIAIGVIVVAEHTGRRRREGAALGHAVAVGRGHRSDVANAALEAVGEDRGLAGRRRQQLHVVDEHTLRVGVAGDTGGVLQVDAVDAAEDRQRWLAQVHPHLAPGTRRNATAHDESVQCGAASHAAIFLQHQGQLFVACRAAHVKAQLRMVGGGEVQCRVREGQAVPVMCAVVDGLRAGVHWSGQRHVDIGFAVTARLP